MSYLLFQPCSSILLANALYTQPLHGANVRTNAFCYAKRYCLIGTDQTIVLYVRCKLLAESKYTKSDSGFTDILTRDNENHEKK